MNEIDWPLDTKVKYTLHVGFLVVFPTRVMYTISGVEGLTNATIKDTNLNVCFYPKNFVKSTVN